MIKFENNTTYLDHIIENLNKENKYELSKKINKLIDDTNSPVFIFYNDYLNKIIVNNGNITDKDDTNPEYNTLIFHKIKKSDENNYKKLIDGFIKDTYAILIKNETDEIFSNLSRQVPKYNFDNIKISPGFLEKYSLKYLYNIFNMETVIGNTIANIFYDASTTNLKEINKKYNDFSIYNKKYLRFSMKIIYDNLINENHKSMSKHHAPAIYKLICTIYRDISLTSEIIITAENINNNIKTIQSFYNNIPYVFIDFSQKYTIINNISFIDILIKNVQLGLKRKHTFIIEEKTLNIINGMVEYAKLFDNNEEYTKSVSRLNELINNNKKFIKSKKDITINLCKFSISEG